MMMMMMMMMGADHIILFAVVTSPAHCRPGRLH
jgi:hypothetical protein